MSPRWSVVLAWSLALVACSQAAADWPQWRGPNRDGQANAVALPAEWPSELALRWKVAVGQGHSGPVVVAQQVFLHSREGDDEVVRALALETGKELWRQSYPAPFQPSPFALGHGKGPKATPCAVEGKLYTVGIDSTLACWDASNGRRLWGRAFTDRFKRVSPLYYGMAASPMVHGELLLAFVGRHGEGALLGLDRGTGESRWEWSGGPGYASAIVARLGGVEQAITQSQKACIGVSLADGSLLWSLPFETEYDQNIVTPVVAGELLIVAGLGKPTTAYRAVRRDGRLTLEAAWRSDESMYMSSPVVAAGRLVGLGNRAKGQFFSLDLTSGKTVWRSEGRQGENAALVASGDQVLAVTTASDLVVFPAGGDKHSPREKYKVAEKAVWAHPAVIGKGILVKDADSLALWEW